MKKLVIISVIVLLLVSLFLNVFFGLKIYSTNNAFYESLTLKSKGVDYPFIDNQIDTCKNLCKDWDSCSYSIRREENKEMCCLYKVDNSGEVLVPPSQCIVLPLE